MRSDKVQIQFCAALVDPDWDTFVTNSLDPHHEQTSLWGNLQRRRGWEAVRIIARKNGSILGGTQLLYRPFGRVFRLGYINRGPILDHDNPIVRDALLNAILACARKLRLVYLALILPYSGRHLIEPLKRLGFFEGPDFLPPRTAMFSTIVLDLSPSLEDILRGMKDTQRKHIRQAERRGLNIRNGNRSDLRSFAGLLISLCERRGERPNIPTDDFLESLWDAFAPQGQVRLFIAEQEQEAVTALLVFHMDRWARSWRIGWSGKYSEKRPNELAYWEAIKWAKAAGCRYFDFVGFDTKMANAMAGGNQTPPSVTCGASSFKLGFGGTVLPLYPRYCLFLNPLLGIPFRLANRSRMLSRALAGLFSKTGLG